MNIIFRFVFVFLFLQKAFNFFLDFNKDVAGFDRNQWQIVLDDCYKRISGKMVL